MAVKDIRKPPAVAPGEGVSEALHSGLYMAKSDTFAVGDTLPVTLFNVPANVYVYDLIINVETAFADSGSGATLIAGYTGDSDAFFASTTKVVAGSHSAKVSSGVKAGGYLSTGTVVEASWATTCSVGGGQALLIFKPYGTEYYNY